MVETATPIKSKQVDAQTLRDHLAPVREYMVKVNGQVLLETQIVIDISKQEVQLNTTANASVDTKGGK
ncbi:MAG: hypothetical protein WC455_21405 [Dehalococcoidia bacterium]|jgi:hypothetical protein